MSYINTIYWNNSLLVSFSVALDKTPSNWQILKHVFHNFGYIPRYSNCKLQILLFRPSRGFRFIFRARDIIPRWDVWVPPSPPPSPPLAPGADLQAPTCIKAPTLHNYMVSFFLCQPLFLNCEKKTFFRWTCLHENWITIIPSWMKQTPRFVQRNR